MAGHGAFRWVGPGTIESEGGPGILWYPAEAVADFILIVDWRLSSAEDNSGVFVRIPALGDRDPDRDCTPAIDGYEVQIDDRGWDPKARTLGSPWHRTGAVYRRAPVQAIASRPAGEWNTFEIEAVGANLRVRLNGVLVSELMSGEGRRRGYVGLQAHHAGSRVRFRRLQIKPL